jgi:DHA1 family multidrug resistance protein-like MFS transporter
MASESWRRNLYVMLVTEFLVITGFGFINPFLPLFIQRLGDFTSDEAALWAGVTIGATSMAMFLSGPIWGIISDRWGRKPMVLRAVFGSAVLQALSSLAPNIYLFIILRFILGFFSGTVPAVSALIASATPREKNPFAMGLLMLCVFSGITIGPSIGGFLADIFGYQACFFIASVVLFLAGLAVMLLVNEDFKRLDRQTTLGDIWQLLRSKALLPILVTICVISASQQAIQPVITLLIQEVDPSVPASSYAGIAFALLGLTAAISSIFSGRLSGRFNLKKILAFACLGATLVSLGPVWISSAVLLVIVIGAVGFFQGANMTATASLIGLALPLSQQGVAFGLSQSAMALGGGLGPSISGALGSVLGLRYVFALAAAFYLLASFVVVKYVRGRPVPAPENA